MRHRPTFHVGPFVVSLAARRDVHRIDDEHRARMLVAALAAEKGVGFVRRFVADERPLAFMSDDAAVLEMAVELLLSGLYVAIDEGREAQLYDDPEEAIPISDLVPDEREPTPHVGATWFELRLCDERGDPLAGVRTHLLVDGATMPVTTDASGHARVDSADGASFASAGVVDLDTVREVLAERWAELRDGDRLEPDDERTFVTCSAAPDGRLARVQLVKHTPHTLVFHPDVTLVRFVGMYFDTAKSFLLPNADLPEIRSIYQRQPHANLLVVGHTDTVGTTEYNDALALERARSVAAYLRDDVDPWLECYTDVLPPERRWGSIEDRLMLDEILRRDSAAPRVGRVHYFQEAHGLLVDGKIGDDTRRALVTAYMALDGVTVPATMTIEVHGCGEHHPLDAAGEELDAVPLDELADVADRRVELFFFADGLGVLPPPPGPTSNAAALEYVEWRLRARQTHEYAKLPKRLLFCFSA